MTDGSKSSPSPTGQWMTWAKFKSKPNLVGQLSLMSNMLLRLTLYIVICTIGLFTVEALPSVPDVSYRSVTHVCTAGKMYYCIKLRQLTGRDAGYQVSFWTATFWTISSSTVRYSFPIIFIIVNLPSDYLALRSSCRHSLHKLQYKRLFFYLFDETLSHHARFYNHAKPYMPYMLLNIQKITSNRAKKKLCKQNNLLHSCYVSLFASTIRALLIFTS